MLGADVDCPSRPDRAKRVKSHTMKSAMEILTSVCDPSTGSVGPMAASENP
jgi:hypothetical protein